MLNLFDSEVLNLKVEMSEVKHRRQRAYNSAKFGTEKLEVENVRILKVA